MMAGVPARRLRILHVIDGSGWRGAEMQALHLLEGTRAKGHAPVLAASHGSPLERRARGHGLDVRPLPAGGLARLLGLRRLLASGGWEAVHLHDLASLRAVARAELLPGAGARPARVLAVRGDVAYGRRVLPAMTPLRRVAHFWAVSEWVRSALVRGGIDEDRISVIHTGVDLVRFTDSPDATRRMRQAARPALGLGPDDFVVGAVLHLTRQKGVEHLIEACRMIRTGDSPPGEARVKLLIVGDGPHRARLQELAARGGMGGAAIFTGFREDVPDLMAAMDVYAHPAVAGDGFPIALREAMAMGLPVVATDLMGIREIIDNGKHGLIAPVADLEGLARNIMRMRRDAALARQAGRSGSLKVQRYSLRAMVDRAEELYFRLVR